MIILKNVTKTFGKKTALRDVSLQIQTGEIVGLLGANGAGKTTTMRLIVGFLKPTSGSVTVADKNPVTDRIGVVSHIGYLPENNPLPLDSHVDEYLQFIMDCKSGHGSHLNEIIEEAGIEDVLSSKIETLSRGYKQRVGLAAALIGDPDIIILDEPTSGLDPIEQEKVKELIKRLGKKRTIILSTHILSEAEDVATQLVIINKGSIVYNGAKPEGHGAVEKIFKKLVIG